jgi:putative acetyltransferase
MASDGLEIVMEDPATPDAQELIRRLNADLAARYGPEDDGSGEFSPADVRVPRSAFVVARLDGRAVGCGALRPMMEAGFEGCAEIKRMYVSPEARGRGLGGAILARLEGLARGFGYARSVLETGTAQPEAIRLYERSGYGRIPSYGPYADDPRSVCFAKAL